MNANEKRSNREKRKKECEAHRKRQEKRYVFFSICKLKNISFVRDKKISLETVSCVYKNDIFVILDLVRKFIYYFFLFIHC